MVLQVLTFLAIAGLSLSQHSIFLHKASKDTLELISDKSTGNSGCIRLENDRGLQYYGTVTMGTPGQSFSVIFDISSPYTWIPGSNCNTSDCNVRSRFNSDLSSTFVSTGQPFGEIYGPGYNKGFFVNDTISFGGFDAKQATFAVMYFLSDFSDEKDAFLYQADGVFGFALPSLADDNFLSPFEFLIQQVDLPQKIFSFYLTPNANETGSSLTIGGYDPTINISTIQYYNLIPNTVTAAWNINVEDFGLGNTSCSPGGALQASFASIDIFIQVPVSSGNNPISSLPGSIPCSDVSSYPNFYLTLAGDTYEVPPRIYYLEIEGVCQLQLQTTPDQAGENWLYVGNAFFRARHVIFDVGNSRIGIASSNETPLEGYPREI